MSTGTTTQSIDYIELCDDDRGSRSIAGFGFNGGKASMTYKVDPDKVIDAVTDLLGDVEPSGHGGLKRALPKRHPRFGWMTVANVNTVQGVGTFERVPSLAAYTTVGPEAVADTFVEHENYWLSLDFEQVRYPLLPDAHPVLKGVGEDYEVDWYDRTGATRTDKASTEWLRFCWGETMPKTEVITATQGQYVFRSQKEPPNLVAFPGRPQLRLPGGAVKFTWVRVPYSWVTHPESWIVKLQGTINQNPWNGFLPGELLYDTAPNIRVYMPPVPAIDEDAGDGVFSTEKLCDIEFVFYRALRDQDWTALPSPGDIANPNWIAAGWNLLPHVGGLLPDGSSGGFVSSSRGFYYATSAGVPGASGYAATLTGADLTAWNAASAAGKRAILKAADQTNKGGWHPSFESSEFALLFSDPNLVSAPLP